MSVHLTLTSRVMHSTPMLHGTLLWPITGAARCACAQAAEGRSRFRSGATSCPYSKHSFGRS